METTLTLTFCGGTGTVTGANFLLDAGEKKILIDCGLEQGTAYAEDRNRENFPYDPSSVNVLLITHAHMDHIGRIPKLVREGFHGTIYSTPATRDLAHPMLEDALKILEDEARQKGVLPLYAQKDIDEAFKLWQTAEYYSSVDLGENLTAYVKDSGHILGSAMFEIQKAGGKKIVFTGDLGNSPSLFLRDTDSIKGASYLVMESVYGDRNHESKEERKEKLTEIIQDTIKRNRTLIIPAFSLERTQDILFEINDLVEKKVIGDIKVFVDSPLATQVTHIYERYTKDFNASAQAVIAKGDDLFDFKKLKFTVHRQESEHIDNSPNPKIIMAGSGMSNGGRIMKHEKHYLPDPNTTILLVGYQAVGTLGRQILDGAKVVEIDGDKVNIKAEVQNIMGYSSHKDSDHLIEFAAEAADTLKKVFVVMGEPKSALFLVQRLRDYAGIDASAPKRGDSLKIEL